MIQCQGVHLKLGHLELFNELSFILHAGEKAGLIGRNGAGKSTLFQLLRRLREPDGGVVSIPKGLRMAWVKQETPALPLSALDYVLEGDEIYHQQALKLAGLEAHHPPGMTYSAEEDAAHSAELGHLYDWMAQTDFYAKPAKASKLLEGLGFSEAETQKPVSSFSGGWRMRLNLAQALMSDSDVLLLDEPTNHLDLEAVLWLENWLKYYPGIVILISHDREFLDQTVNVILHLEHQQIRRYSGNYSQFERAVAMQRAEQEAAFQKQQRERAHMQSFVDRFRAQATKATQAQSRLKALERMADIAPLHERTAFSFEFRPLESPVKGQLIQMVQGSLGYGSDIILDKVQLAISPGERIGFLGPNGAGKSTLIKALSREAPLLSGEIQVSQKLKLGYFSQHQMEILVSDRSPAWHVQKLTPTVSEQTLRQFLGQFQFQGDRVFEPIEYFSGGEKARLALALMVWQQPNVLLMDEPTNHLDMEMREALILALQSYEGAVVLISHDRHLLRTCVDEFYLVYEGKVKRFEGSVDDYPAWWAQELKRKEKAYAEQIKRQQMASKSQSKDAPVTSSADTLSTLNHAESSQVALTHSALSNHPSTVSRERPPMNEGRRKALLKQLHKAEEELAQSHQVLLALELELSSSALYEDPQAGAKLKNLLEKQRELQSSIRAQEDQVLALMSALTEG